MCGYSDTANCATNAAIALRTPLIDVLLRSACLSELTLRSEQGMIPAFYYMKVVLRLHVAYDLFQKVQRAKRIAGPLDE